MELKDLPSTTRSGKAAGASSPAVKNEFKYLLFNDLMFAALTLKDLCIQLFLGFNTKPNSTTYLKQSFVLPTLKRIPKLNTSFWIQKRINIIRHLVDKIKLYLFSLSSSFPSQHI